MAHLPHTASDEAVVAFVDEWVRLLEEEDYARAFSHTAHAAGTAMTPARLRDHLQQQIALHASCFDPAYGELDPRRRVTRRGTPTHVAQVKEVDRWPKNAQGVVGEVWYNLNFDGFATEYTALFQILEDDDGLTLALSDIGVR